MDVEIPSSLRDSLKDSDKKFGSASKCSCSKDHPAEFACNLQPCIADKISESFLLRQKCTKPIRPR